MGEVWEDADTAALQRWAAAFTWGEQHGREEYGATETIAAVIATRFAVELTGMPAPQDIEPMWREAGA